MVLSAFVCVCQRPILISDRVYWGKGIATQALSKLLQLKTTRPLYAYVARHNIASRWALEKCGFTLTSDDTPSTDMPAEASEEYLFVLPG